MSNAKYFTLIGLIVVLLLSFGAPFISLFSLMYGFGLTVQHWDALIAGYVMVPWFLILINSLLK